MAESLEQLEVDLQDDSLEQQTPASGQEEKIEVEIVNDGAPVEEQRAPRNEEAFKKNAPTEIPEDELASYSERVRKRIKQLSYYYHEEQRQKQAEAQAKEEAFRYAQAVAKQNEELRRIVAANHAVAKKSMGDRTSVQLEDAKKSVKAAFEAGDAEKLVEAQERLAKLVQEQGSIQAIPDAPNIPAYEPPQVQQPQQLNPRLRQWMSENSWFDPSFERGNDGMTSYAIAFHSNLVARGVQPDTEAYYDAIDSEMRTRFPEAFGTQQQETQKPQQARKNAPVAPVSRAGNSTVRKIRLNQNQVDLAKRLGITPEQYAAQLKEMEQ